MHLENDSRGKIVPSMAPIARVARRGTDSRRGLDGYAEEAEYGVPTERRDV